MQDEAKPVKILYRNVFRRHHHDKRHQVSLGNDFYRGLKMTNIRRSSSEKNASAARGIKQPARIFRTPIHAAAGAATPENENGQTHIFKIEACRIGYGMGKRMKIGRHNF
ncbi:hypothetical protein P9G49_07150 [Heyndrickxia coagulans]|uniref:hypothetical protein n=1 Tax=Heyndrickxia coagulans TaxID=1398 RepID=UPI002E01EF9B|nr:hypothetical protein [Heyndrickxia coagulans]